MSDRHAPESVIGMGRNTHMTEQKPQSLTFADRDEFKRRDVAEKLIGLLKSDIHVSPMILDGKWGTGKTEFCCKLINLLTDEHAEFKSTYIDAFKSDHANDPLAMLVAAIANLVEDQSARSEFLEKAIPAVRFGMKTAGKAAVAWILKQNADALADEFEEALQEAGEASINESVERLIRDHQEASQNLATLRQSLGNIALAHPLVIFVDELDRCRPDFAVSIIENIKHIFDVPNVQFVLVANIDQLKESILHRYGPGVDAQRYLDKFVRFAFTLSPSVTEDKYTYFPAATAHAKNLISNSSSLRGMNDGSTIAQELIDTLITENHLSLREVEKFVSCMEVYDHLCGNHGFYRTEYVGPGLFRLLGIYYFCFEREICNQILRDYFPADPMVAVFGVTSAPPPAPQSHGILNAMAAAVYLNDVDAAANPSGFKEEYINLWTQELASTFFGPRRRGAWCRMISDVVRTLSMIE